MKKARSPIVTVLGHVDHGKTTLLDVIRKTNVAAREVGGITQSIGASKIITKEGPMTFVDTPGHAAFESMRARGVKLADIVLLVVASDDGVKPQTLEALKYIKDTKTPFIVVFTKIDLPSSDVERVRSQLENEGVLFEGRGGDTPYVLVSAKEGRGIDELLEIIYLLSEINEISGDEEADFEAYMVETKKDKSGLKIIAVVKNGILKIGDEIESGGVVAKVRGLFDENSKSIREARPGDPIQILGFSELPQVGSIIKFSKDVEGVVVKEKKEDQENQIQEGDIPIILKASTSGALEAVVGSLPKKIFILKKEVGEITESDIFLAKAGKARIFCFGSKPTSSIRKLADTEGVDIESFQVIYELTKRAEELLEEKEEKILASALIVDSFPFDKKRVAGCKIEKGQISVKDSLELYRENRRLGIVKIVSIKKKREEVSLVKAGEECGIIFEPQLDFDKGDVLVSRR